MVADNMGLALAVSLSWACRNDPQARQLLPLMAFPLLATGDLCSIYRELKSIHLRNLNKERAEIVAEMWLEAGRIPSAAEVLVHMACMALCLPVKHCYTYVHFWFQLLSKLARPLTSTGCGDGDGFPLPTSFS